MKESEMKRRSSLTLLLMLGLMALPGFHHSLARAGQSGSIVSSIKLNRIQLIALTVGSDGQTKECAYTLRESPLVRLSLKNQTGEEIPLRQNRDRFSQYRFELQRDGVLVEPRAEVTKRLKQQVASEDRWGSVTVLDPVKPYQTANIALIRLNDWYDQLVPGHYHLTVHYLIANSEDMKIVASTDFYVEP